MPGLVYGRYRVQDLECGYIALYSALIIIVYYLTNKLTWDRNSAIINITNSPNALCKMQK